MGDVLSSIQSRLITPTWRLGPTCHVHEQFAHEHWSNLEPARAPRQRCRPHGPAHAVTAAWQRLRVTVHPLPSRAGTLVTHAARRAPPPPGSWFSSIRQRLGTVLVSGGAKRVSSALGFELAESRPTRGWISFDQLRRETRKKTLLSRYRKVHRIFQSCFCR